MDPSNETTKYPVNIHYFIVILHVKDNRTKIFFIDSFTETQPSFNSVFANTSPICAWVYWRLLFTLMASNIENNIIINLRQH